MKYLMQINNYCIIKQKLFIFKNLIRLILKNLHAVSMINRSRSFTLRQVLSIIIIYNKEKLFKMFSMSLSTCNWNDIASLIFSWLTDSTHFTFNIKKKLIVKTADEFAFYIRKKVQFYRRNLHTLCEYGVIIHQKQSKCP